MKEFTIDKNMRGSVVDPFDESVQKKLKKLDPKTRKFVEDQGEILAIYLFRLQNNDFLLRTHPENSPKREELENYKKEILKEMEESLQLHFRKTIASNTNE